MVKEKIIREKLAKNITILEDGLVFIEEEHLLPNKYGAKGFIDILAKDKYGNSVIIELKRSNQSSRQALHEIFKYVALFSIHHGLPSYKIRCFVVSTEWHELKIPFSRYIKTTKNQTTGFAIKVDSDGNIISSNRIEPLDLPDDIKPFEQHSLYLFIEKKERDASIIKLSGIVNNLGCESYFILSVNYSGENSRVIYPFGIYFVPINLHSSIYEELKRKVRKEYEVEDDEITEKNIIEGEFLASVSCNSIGNDTFEIGYPEKFFSMKFQGWKTSEVFRKGLFESKSVLSDKEIENFVSGTEGQNPIRFYRTSSPSIQLDWNNLKESIFRTIHGNQRWLDGVNWFCSLIEEKYNNSSVSFEIYNPLCLPISLYKFFTTKDKNYLPVLEIIAWDEKKYIIRNLIGIIEWDNLNYPDSFTEIISRLFGDFYNFMLSRNLGESWLYDSQIMELHGFHYNLRLGRFSRDKAEISRILILKENNEMKMIKDTNSYASIYDFINANRGFVDELLNVFKKEVVEI